ncbi:XdhC family protein [Hyphococcus sp. DH-69]|uniref:XdhC family protein n=1 Tax=Hyphococcus formosus TaxID=3143534 RepID=UPI00398B57CA
MPNFKQINNIGEHAVDQFGFIDQCHQKNLKTALVTIVGIIGRASRKLGAHMVVCEDGTYAGSVSSGCIDGNVVAMALDAIETGQSKRVQFGEGSPFVDVKLPCGGGVDLLILPMPDADVVRNFLDQLMRRETVSLELSEAGISLAVCEPRDEIFQFTYEPKIRLCLAGRGLELLQFCRTAAAADFEIISYTPDGADRDACAAFGKAFQLSAIGDVNNLKADQWTAIILLFHEHEWEPPLLEQALATDAFYVGALGSKVTHEARIEALKLRGVDQSSLDRLRGPIGLVPSMRNASMLAISTLAEIIDHFQRRRSNG